MANDRNTSMGDVTKKRALMDSLARVAKALGSGKRLEIVDLLAQSEYSVEQLVKATGSGFSTVSANLQTLKAAGLVATRRDGTRIYYSLAGDDVAALYRLARDVAANHLADVERAATDYLGDDPRQLTREELTSQIASGEVMVLDVRPEIEYEAGHIPGARSMPVDELNDRLAELPDDVQVVAYCRGAYCVFAHDAVKLLVDTGRSAVRLEDGMLEWRLAGLPIATGTTP